MKIEGLRVLVTGGAGFIGSHIVESLVKKGAEVVVYDNFSSGSMENLKHLEKDIKVVKGDILDYNKVLEACKGIDVISHQAAQLEITKCIDDPIEDLKINTIGSLNVFNAAIRNDVKKIIYASSACVYGQARYIPQDENHPTNPNWQYGVSKLAVEKYANIYSNYYGIPMIGLRYSIVYGPREWYGRVLTVFLKRAMEGKLPVVWEGNQIRDFVYVDDVVSLHNLCIENDEVQNEIFNVSTGIGTSVEQLAKLIINIFGLKGNLVYENVKEGEVSKLVEGRKRLPMELKKMVLDNKKAKKILGWEPTVELKDGLIREFEWLRSNKHRWKKMSY
jgi:UDP-glucose 4-epimerase